MQLTVEVDHDRAYALGLTPMQVSDALFRVRHAPDQYHLHAQQRVLRHHELPEFQNNPDKLSLLYVRSNAGAGSLDTVAKLVPSVDADGESPGQLPAATISFNLKPGIALGDATKWSNAKPFSAADDIQGTFQGTAQAFQNSFTGMGLCCSPPFW
jgi:HAE1 family hydrophobic/amphiphilic exporter-1